LSVFECICAYLRVFVHLFTAALDRENADVLLI
jgi:hypothetical protein